MAGDGTSTALGGMKGLNAIPNARMDKTGTIRGGISTSDPYINSFIGFQIFEPLYINMRQTAEISSFRDSPKQLYPGLDFKLRLAKETTTRPEISIGADSAIGHKRTASEYIVFSKRRHNFDFTGGIGWGRLAGKGHIKNPFGVISSHFDEKRDFNNDQTAGHIDGWLTGEDIGFFGGIEYFTPFKGLSVKLDYGGYNYAPETTTNAGFKQPSPWSASLNYQPWAPMDISVGTIGGDKVMARLSLQGDISKWPLTSTKAIQPPSLIYPRGNYDGKSETTLYLNQDQSTGAQIGLIAREIANQSAADNEAIEISLKHKNLKGPKLKIIRRDLEEALLNNHGSAEEIWQDTNLMPNQTKTFSLENYFNDTEYKKFNIRFILDNKISLAEEDTNILYRTKALVEFEQQFPFGFNLGLTPQVNIANNLSNIRAFKPLNQNAIRSDEDEFAGVRVSLERAYLSWLHSITQSTHINVTAGHLEEMYAGYGGEILYRPFGKTIAVGAEGWNVYKRDPFSRLNIMIEDEHNFTGHLNLFYEVPNTQTTIFTKAGKYLNDDWGGTIGVKSNFKNGTSLEGFFTATNKTDPDIFGGNNNLYSGLKFTLPLGSIPFVPKGSALRLTTAPFARDAGQALNAPNKLYEVTEPTAFRRLRHSWPDLLD